MQAIDILMHDVLQSKLLKQVKAERDRQDDLQAQGKFPCTCADTPNFCQEYWTGRGLVRAGKLAILTEELGEVSRHVNEALIDERRYQPEKLKKELIEVAAVAIAWAESIEHGDS